MITDALVGKMDLNILKEQIQENIRFVPSKEIENIAKPTEVNPTKLTPQINVGIRQDELSPTSSFEGMLRSGAESINTVMNEAKELEHSYLKGETDNIHQITFANKKAELVFDLGIEIRNKIVEGIQELMRMSV